MRFPRAQGSDLTFRVRDWLSMVNISLDQFNENEPQDARDGIDR